jgi:hypothetical protein
MKPGELLGAWLAKRLPLHAADWLGTVAGLVQAAPADRPLYLAIGEVSRRVPRQPLAPTEADLAVAAASRPGWDPHDWTLDQAARVRLLLASTADGALLSRRLDTLCSAADVGELVAFYRGLPLYPDPPRHVLRAAEGVRSNMRVVFEAVAHRNPYPAEHFVESAWNQMVLKALFVGTRLDLIAGLDRRANPALARMLCDYAHERWAASRPVSPELWRCVGPFATGAVLDDFRRLLERGTGTEKQAAALALATAEDAGAKALLDSHPALAEAARGGSLDWESLATAGT